MFDFIDIHRIFSLLGQPEGNLFKKAIEFILLFLISYMIMSEFSKDSRRDLKYLIVAFVPLTISKLISVFLLSSMIFGNLDPIIYFNIFPIFDNALEVFALILLSNAFLFPLLKDKYGSLKNNIKFQLTILSSIFFILVIGLFLDVYRANYLSSLLFTIMKLVLLMSAVYILSTQTHISYAYRYSAIMAFLVYFVTPFLTLINIAFYNNQSARLLVAEHPFPILSILLFTRVIYLKLVDKAFLKKKLKISELKYQHEKRLNELKDKFVSIVSHELRTPLTSIKLYSSLLEKGKLGKVNQKQVDASRIIKDESSRLNNLVSDILDLSKLESKSVKLLKSNFYLQKYIGEAIFNSLAKDKGIKIINKVPKNFTLFVDPDKFKQVIINIVSNAIKFTEKGGSITISAKKNKVEISDTGKGIPPKELEKIFDKFYQAEHYMTRKHGGSGLGLTIANEIMKLHDGEIKVKSKLNHGSVFSICFPKRF